MADFIVKAASKEMTHLSTPTDTRNTKTAALDNTATAQELALEALHQAVSRRFSPSPDPDPVLTTEQAAKLVGVSRPYMVKLIDSGAVVLHMMAGNRRRVRRSAVICWHAAERTRQAKALKHLAMDLDEEVFSAEPLPAVMTG